MFNIIRKEMEWAGRKLVLETGKIARQADGAVMVTYGETTILATVVFEKKPNQARDFLPLTVHYREMSFAAGKIPGGFFKREGRASEKETLVSRLIDRPIRPLFPESFHNEVQVLCTVLSHDLINDPDVLSIVAASAALAVSGAPITRTIGGVRVAYINDECVINPTIKDALNSRLDLVVAGTADSVMMVESEAQELTEEQMLNAVEFGHNSIKEVIKFIDDFATQVNKNKIEVISNVDNEIDDMVAKFAKESLTEAFTIKDKLLRNNKRSEIEEKTIEALVSEDKEVTAEKIKKSLSNLEYNIVRNSILDHKKRIDGRNPEEIRPIVSEIDLLHRTHGSALFTRGETQALVVATLGTSQDEQVIDSLEGESKSHFMLHYNFPSYSVGEVAPLKSPGRREIGHGKLAWRAMRAVLPTKTEFPYTLRLVSEITESNGSSSMATVCGSSLALMDAGVPIRKSVAGIAMGLILDKNRYVILSDIMGDEDHLGDMDFKVAGTKDGITALQMDIKIEGITIEIMKKALAQAKNGREHILGEMNKAITEPKTSVNANAPTITTMQINKDKIREVIGSGGKVIRGICEESGAKIEIDDNGVVKIAATSQESKEKALSMVLAIVSEAEVGKIYDGKVVKIAEFGAFVNFMGARDGLVHISELAANRVAKVDEVVKEGQMVKVKVLDIDPKGKIKLSMKVVDQTSGEDISAKFLPKTNDVEKTERSTSEKNTGKRPVRKESSKVKKDVDNNDGGDEDPKPTRKYYS